MSETVLITGAASGIGLSFTKIFAEKGYELVLVGRNEKKLDEIKNEIEAKQNIKVTVLIEDLSIDGAAKNIYDNLKAQGINVDILINNAGLGDFGRFIDTPYEAERDILGVNVISLMHLTHLFANDMVKRGKGRILNVSSIAAYVPGPYMPIYYASKAFVYFFSEAIAHELKGTGVTVTTYNPGPTETNFEKNAKMEGSKMFNFKLLKVGTPEHVAMEGYNALMSGKLLHHSYFKYDIFKFITRFGPERLKLFITTYINTGSFK